MWVSKYVVWCGVVWCGVVWRMGGSAWREGVGGGRDIEGGCHGWEEEVMKGNYLPVKNIVEEREERWVLPHQPFNSHPLPLVWYLCLSGWRVERRERMEERKRGRYGRDIKQGDMIEMEEKSEIGNEIML